MSPANVRPSWIEVDVDGRDTNIATGPRSRAGDMSIRLYVRENGGVKKCLDIDCIASYDKQTVTVRVRSPEKGDIYEEKFNQ